MKCPRQSAFVKLLDELLSIHRECNKDRFSVDETYKLMDEFSQKKKHFVNLWCPTFKEYEEY